MRVKVYQSKTETSDGLPNVTIYVNIIDGWSHVTEGFCEPGDLSLNITELLDGTADWSQATVGHPVAAYACIIRHPNARSVRRKRD